MKETYFASIIRKLKLSIEMKAPPGLRTGSL